MAAPIFDRFTVLSPGHEMTQIEAAVSGAPGGKVFTRQVVKDYPFAELMTLQNLVTGGPSFTKWIEYDPQARLTALLACTSMAWNNSPPTPVPLNPYSRTTPPNPPGVRAP